MWWNPYAGLSKLLHRMCICTDAESQIYSIFCDCGASILGGSSQTLSSPTVRSWWSQRVVMAACCHCDLWRCGLTHMSLQNQLLTTTKFGRIWNWNPCLFWLRMLVKTWMFFIWIWSCCLTCKISNKILKVYLSTWKGFSKKWKGFFKA